MKSAKRASSILKIGLLGGGQLARMLALKGHELGLSIHVLSQNRDDPAAQVVKHHHVGDPKNENDLKNFLGHVDVATFESEFLNSELLASLSREAGVEISPDPKIMGLIQDRLEQKKLLVANKIPTASYVSVSSTDEARAALKRFGGKLVLKQRRFGYDGYGTFVIDSEASLNKIAHLIEGNAQGFIAEDFIPFKRELALVFARRASGEKLTLPLVETFQENSRCLWVKGPVAHDSVAAFSKSFLKFIEKIDYCGVIAVELFETKSGLVVNELAPRVHNSGHYSLDALVEDQFTLHLKGVLNLPFSKVEKIKPAFAMLNLLGTHSKPASWTLPPDLKLHWYGKTENRPGRKMGHVVCVAGSPQAALKKLLSLRSKFKV